MNLFSFSRNTILSESNYKASSFYIFLLDKIKSICFSSYPENKFNVNIKPFLSSLDVIINLFFDLPSIIKSLTSFFLY